MTVTETHTDVEQKVGKGVTYLDEHIPGWRDQVDGDRLDMQNACDCVLGQLLGSFYRLSEIGLSYHQAYEMGFEARSGGASYGELGDAWRSVL